MSYLTHDRRILLTALAAGLPAVIIALVLLWVGDFTPKVQWTLTVLILGCWWALSFAVRERVVLPLQTVSNLLSALREDDFSIRARGARSTDPLGEVMIEVNALAETLHQQRLGALEATALARTVMAEIDVAVFTFDGEGRLMLVNRSGERVLGQPAERLLGRSAPELGLTEYLDGESPRIIDASFPGGAGKWEVRRTTFREGGLPHRLLVLSDLSRPLRDEERQAWQRLIRVLGHELNNSLAPIKSVAGSLETLLNSPETPSGNWREDMKRGLTVIAGRAAALGRFTAAYARLARLPKPTLEPVSIAALVRGVVRLETRVPIQIEEGPAVTVSADRDQLEQLLINLLRNAVDAALETKGSVRVGWTRVRTHLELWIDDEGPGLSNTANLFVPFFTTKPGGSGIGLVLSRQIAEAHGGALTLEPRQDRLGTRARLRLPATSILAAAQ